MRESAIVHRALMCTVLASSMNATVYAGTDTPRDQTSGAFDMPPTIDFVSPMSYTDDGCCDAGWRLLIMGSDFRRCFSVLITTPDLLYEILPTPDVADCDLRRGTASLESPRERLIQQLPPDGMTISCTTNEGFIPLRPIAPGYEYKHDLICEGSASVPFCTVSAVMQPALPPEVNYVTTGGAAYWVSESEIRVLFGPPIRAACGKTLTVDVSISNDPGRGRTGSFFSNRVKVDFTNTLPDPVPPDQGNVLRAVRQGDHVRLDFSGAAAPSWRILRAENDRTSLSARALMPDLTTTSFMDWAVIAWRPQLYYSVRGVSPCSGDAGP